ncbi:hypothetical protein AY599_19340 [Leptolyngbya valderiana BDU 20041]|nr:hypothetical protein AY599_19340 [Leptolyngbya valderiana BDU 20041]
MDWVLFHRILIPNAPISPPHHSIESIAWKHRNSDDDAKSRRKHSRYNKFICALDFANVSSPQNNAEICA